MPSYSSYLHGLERQASDAVPVRDRLLDITKAHKVPLQKRLHRGRIDGVDVNVALIGVPRRNRALYNAGATLHDGRGGGGGGGGG